MLRGNKWTRMQLRTVAEVVAAVLFSRDGTNVSSLEAPRVRVVLVAPFQTRVHVCPSSYSTPGLRRGRRVETRVCLAQQKRGAV